jgi:hypothetical protein
VPGRARTRYSATVPDSALRVRAQAIFQTVNPAHLPPGTDSLRHLTRSFVAAERTVEIPARSGR